MIDLNSSRVSLTLCVVLAGLLHPFPSLAGQRLSAADADSVAFGRLDNSTRARLDQLAREAGPGPSKLNRQLESYTDLSAFLLSRVSLPADEESRRSDSEHRCLLDRYPVQSAPADVQAVVQQLERQLSENLKRGARRFEVFLVDDTSRTAFTLGNGRIYLSRKYFEGLFTDPHTDRERLAFVLAHEMGHQCRGHVRRRYQSEWLIEQSDRVIDRKTDTTAGATVNKLLVRGVDGCLRFMYSFEEDLQADLFAWHLCRNAGFEDATIQDPLRERMLVNEEAVSATADARQPGQETRRLRALLFEQAGVLEDDDYGLLAFDAESQQYRKAASNSLPADARVVVFVHGMESRPEKFRQMALAVQNGGTQLLAFRYPNDGSLALAGKFLTNELQRVCPAVEHLDFVCHSAGGLVFRWYAEVEEGPFHQAVLIATPHGGSSLARLRNFFDVVHFIQDFKFDEANLLEQVLRDTEGQIGFDLQPGSLFLSYLDRESDEHLRERYTILRGRAMKRRSALLLRGAVTTGQLAIESQLVKRDMPAEWREVLRNGLSKMEVPLEVSSGDLAVTLESAALEGVRRIETLNANHVRIVDHEQTLKIVSEILNSE